MDTIITVGRRKAAVARVYLSEGKGNITINNRKFEEYFTVPQLQKVVTKSFEVTENMGKFDIKAILDGGGTSGQADALALGIARALVKLDEENRALLKPYGLLTRDPRVIERKKPGQKKARKKFQFSKR
ncbi:MAG: 30S ribosomal protein S9 [Bacteroidales bacterium]|jgi:small subunit ribosomal protein S9|nr:30S ribosomal protein S9 [Bacteroidales bacterium]